jgi:hypothetical protein
MPHVRSSTHCISVNNGVITPVNSSRILRPIRYNQPSPARLSNEPINVPHNPNPTRLHNPQILHPPPVKSPRPARSRTIRRSPPARRGIMRQDQPHTPPMSARRRAISSRIHRLTRISARRQIRHPPMALPRAGQISLPNHRTTGIHPDHPLLLDDRRLPGSPRPLPPYASPTPKRLPKNRPPPRKSNRPPQTLTSAPTLPQTTTARSPHLAPKRLAFSRRLLPRTVTLTSARTDGKIRALSPEFQKISSPSPTTIYPSAAPTRAHKTGAAAPL